MCGIAGILALRPGLAPPSRTALQAMAAVQQHRGPDEFGIYRDHMAGLAHARLSIVDIQQGQQPMQAGDSGSWIVFNGEIFNHVELRAELLACGHVFQTRSDTEVILHAWREWGVAAFARMNGQWALALWDAKLRSLLLCRDPMGICPLHLYEHGGYLYFASEVKALFVANADLPRAFDPVGLAQTFTFWSTVAPQSVYRGVTELEPGQARLYQLEAHGCRVSEHTIAPPAWSPFRGSLEDATCAVQHALAEATRLRMLRADVPVGSYLSGGLDSAWVAALGLQHSGSGFQTFSLRFEDAEFDETQFQRQMVQRLGSAHADILVSRQAIAETFAEVVYHTERPILRSAPAPLFLLSRLVREQGIKVVLTGEGADEMFAGYDLFREAKVRRFWARQPQSAWRHRLLERLYPYLARSPVSQRAMAKQFFGRGLAQHADAGFAHGPRWQTTQALQRLFTPDMQASLQGTDCEAEFLANLPAEFATWDPLAQDQHIEVRTLLSGYLLSSQGDRMLLGHSVEGRFPFLDPHVMALAHSLPAQYKLRGLDEKHVLKRAARGQVPPDILARKKQPYRAPDALCFVGPGAPEAVQDALSDAALREAQVFELQATRQLIHKCRARAQQGGHGAPLSNADNMALLGVLSTQLLHQQFIAQRPMHHHHHPARTDIDLTQGSFHAP